MLEGWRTLTRLRIGAACTFVRVNLERALTLAEAAAILGGECIHRFGHAPVTGDTIAASILVRPEAGTCLFTGAAWTVK